MRGLLDCNRRAAGGAVDALGGGFDENPKTCLFGWSL